MVLIAGCASSKSSSTTATTAASATSTLLQACGSKIVIQIDWFPEPEFGGIFQLAGPNGTVDKKTGTYTSQIKSTGVTIEIRPGGPFVGSQPVSSLMYQDKSILLGTVSTDEAVKSSNSAPTVAVVAPLAKSPAVLMYSPASHNFNGFADVGQSGAKVLEFEGSPYVDYLIGKGYLKSSQVDYSFDGSPDRFVASNGSVVQDALATEEVYYYSHPEDPQGIKQWGKPVKYLLIADSGYVIYTGALAVRPDVLVSKAACLHLLVPMIQRSQLDYITNPIPVNAAIVNADTAIGQFWQLSVPGTAYSASAMKQLGIVANGTDGSLGSFDLTRVSQVIGILEPIYAKRNVTLKAGLAPADLVTNQFVDHSVHF